MNDIIDKELLRIIVENSNATHLEANSSDLECFLNQKVGEIFHGNNNQRNEKDNKKFF